MLKCRKNINKNLDFPAIDYSSNCLMDTQKGSFDNSTEMISRKSEFFWLKVRNWSKNTCFSSYTFFRQRLFWTQKCKFDIPADKSSAVVKVFVFWKSKKLEEIVYCSGKCFFSKKLLYIRNAARTTLPKFSLDSNFFTSRIPKKMNRTYPFFSKLIFPRSVSLTQRMQFWQSAWWSFAKVIFFRLRTRKRWIKL